MHIITISISLLFSLIDIYLIDIYLNNLFLENNYKIYKNIIKLIFMFIINLNLFNLFIVNFLFLIMYSFYCIKDFEYSKSQLITFMLLVIFIKFFIPILIIPLSEWIFDTSVTLKTYHLFLSYRTLIFVIERYIAFITVNLISNMNRKIPNIKILIILFFSYFSITTLINNEAFFYYQSVGRTFIFIMTLYILTLIFFDRYQTKHEQIEREMAIVNHNILCEKDYMVKYNESKDTLRDMRHDLKNNYSIISGYLSDGDIESAQKYINKMSDRLEESSSIEHLGHPCIDSVIDDKINIMKEKNIAYEEDITPIYLGKIEIEDIALLIGIALDNAIEAAERCQENKSVKLKIRMNKNLLILNFENSIPYGTHPKFSITSKRDKLNHGFGVKKIKFFTEKYNGDMNYITEKDQVILKIILHIEK